MKIRIRTQIGILAILGLLFISISAFSEETEPVSPTVTPADSNFVGDSEDSDSGWLVLKGKGYIETTVRRRGHHSENLKGQAGDSFEIPSGLYTVESIKVSPAPRSEESYSAFTRTIKPLKVVEGATQTLEFGGPLHYVLSADYYDRSRKAYLSCLDLINDASIEFTGGALASWEVRDVTGTVVDSGKFVPG